jgi:hypothetical protein
VWLWLVVLAVLGYAAWRLFLGYPRPRERMPRLAAREVAFLDAAAEALFPPGGAMPISGAEAGIPRWVDHYFETLHPRQRRLIRLLFLFFEQATFFFPAPGGLGGFRRFSALGPPQREAVLEAWATSPLFLRRLVFMALRAVLTMAYLGHPTILRHLRLAPYDFPSPILDADVLYPPIGRHPNENPFGWGDVTPPSDGTPLDLDGPLHPDYAEGGTAIGAPGRARSQVDYTEWQA